MFFQLTDGQFAIFFPEDVHAPMIGVGEIKKLVVKVRFKNLK
jgi:YhcH/YjgK/YiaL family protein